jgi:hypothetical protein
VKLGRRLVNKAAEIRATAQKMIDEGRPPRPVEIVDALAKRQIRVKAAQVCVALRDTNLALSHHLPRVDRSFAPLPAPAAAIAQVSIDDLLKARDFVQLMGTAEKAIAALVAFRQFNAPKSGHAVEEPAEIQKLAQ